MPAAHRTDSGVPAGAPASGGWLIRLGRQAWAVVGLVAVAVVVWIVLARLAVVVVPLLIALFPAAALAPLVHWLDRRGLPRPLAALVAVLGLIVLVAGLVAATVPAFVTQLPSLTESVRSSLDELQPLLSRLPGVPDGTTFSDLARQAGGGLTDGGALQATLRATGTVVNVLGGLVLLVIALFFYLYQGERMFQAAVRVLPRRAGATVGALGDPLWETLGRFVRAQFLVALVDAVFIGIGIALLGVPLALPLAVLVFLGSFLPYIGATVSGLLAALVALADGGPGLALAVVAVVVAVQQLEGYLLEPLLTGRMVRLPAFVVIVAIAAGATLLGVLGAFLAVPVVACLARLAEFFGERGLSRGRLVEPRPGQSPGQLMERTSQRSAASAAEG